MSVSLMKIVPSQKLAYLKNVLTLAKQQHAVMEQHVGLKTTGVIVTVVQAFKAIPMSHVNKLGVNKMKIAMMMKDVTIPLANVSHSVSEIPVLLELHVMQEATGSCAHATLHCKEMATVFVQSVSKSLTVVVFSMSYSSIFSILSLGARM